MCRSSRHSELATSRLSTAFGEHDDTCEQVIEAEQPQRRLVGVNRVDKL